MMEKKSIIILLSISLYFPSLIFAETIVLKSRKTIEGKIIEKTDNYIRVEIAGASVIYFLDEIESIDGESYQSVPGKKDNITTGQLDTVPVPVEESLERKQVLEYINKSDFIIKGMNTEIANKQTLLAQASMLLRAYQSVF